MTKQLRIYTFGRFHISDYDKVLVDATSSKSKIWGTLKYLVAFYGKPVPAAQLAEAMWPDEEYGDPAKLLRNTIYQLRKTLASYCGERQYIVFNNGNYLWKPDADCWIDFVEFDGLMNRARDTSAPIDKRVELYNKAIDLYEGPFLRNSAIEIWTLTFTDYYRKQFLQTVNELADLYESEFMFDEIVATYDKAIASEPYEESLYSRQIQTLINNGEYAYARRQYRLFEKIIMREFGAAPSRSLQQLSYEIEKASINQADSLEQITQFFESGDKKNKAIFCGPETFRQIYMLDKRSDERIHFPIYMVLLTLASSPDLDEMNREHELKVAMKALRQVLLQSLRAGDVVSQYSQNQFILMLTVLDNDGGVAALRRIKYLFEKKFEKGRGRLEYHLSPIGKDMSGPVAIRVKD